MSPNLNVPRSEKMDAQASAVSPQSGLSFIEQLQIVSEKKCEKEKRPTVIGVNGNEEKAVSFKPNCKMWNCEACAARATRYWIARIINGVNRLGGEWQFFTITAHKKHRKEKSITNIRQGWKKLYNRILAKYLNKIRGEMVYVKVWEQHKDGTFHLHGLINTKIAARWLKDNSAQCGMGYQTEIHEVDNAGQIAGYIAKYSLKNASVARGGVEFPKGLRRIEVSRNFPKFDEPEKDPNWNWYVYMQEIEASSMLAFHKQIGFEIEDNAGVLT